MYSNITFIFHGMVGFMCKIAWHDVCNLFYIDVVVPKEDVGVVEDEKNQMPELHDFAGSI